MDNTKMMNEIMENIKDVDHIPADLINQARKLANSKAGRDILKELNNSGINKEFIEKAIQSQKAPIGDKQVLIIRPNGIVKTKKIIMTDGCPSFLHANKPVDIICTKLNMNKTIKIWYDSDIKYVNKRASKYTNITIHGIAIIYSESGDLTVNELLVAEKQLK